ncbi:hypothetical protein CWC11_20115 [Pseudoalteromonas sp. S3178]|nr:SMI1/KNR4 family protein [Pseudoalteromonas sp. S3178]TMP02022.1 hypothetical protein CWC11_20115 [Pseudoalteromonas sp. S3178]
MSTILDVQSMLSEMSSNEDISIGVTHSSEEIANAEAYLNVSLPEEYKAFLKKIGYLCLGSLEYYGLTRSSDFSTAGIPNFVWFTAKKRDEINLPKSLIVFQNLNDEIYYCLNASPKMESFGNVIVWNNLSRTVDDTLEISFLDFIVGDIDEYKDEYET